MEKCGFCRKNIHIIQSSVLYGRLLVFFAQCDASTDLLPYHFPPPHTYNTYSEELPFLCMFWEK